MADASLDLGRRDLVREAVSGAAVVANLPAAHFGPGHGTGARAPDEYYLIESSNPKVQGLDGAVASFVESLYALA
jgi:hypothetical protein